MKRYLTVGIIFGVLVAVIVSISWIAFPAWRDPASGGFLTLLGATIVGVLAFLQGAVSLWKGLKEEKKEDTKPSAPMQSVDSQNAESIYNAPGGTINVYPSATTSSEPISEEPDFWFIPHPYPMPLNFTGRDAEQQILDEWLADDTNRLFILRALGGFGKSALSWQWINTHVNPAEWTKLVWWSFYEGDASFEHFIEETLKYLNIEVPQGQRPQVDALLKAMQGSKILLIMDGFERALRAYSSMNAAYQGDDPKVEENQLDCVNINAEIFLKSVCSMPNITSKVLMTTRLTPRAVKTHDELLQGCFEKELKEMDKVDAVAFFHAQGIKGNRTEIEAACTPYGYHPLSLRLLAGRILKDFENPADIIVAQKLKFDGDIIQQKHHVLEVSYNSLPEYEQKMLSTIACFRSPVELKTLEAIADNVVGTRYTLTPAHSADVVSLQDDLHDLVTRGLLHFDEKNKKFDLHPIVRRFAYDRLAATQRKDTHVVLVVYFEAISQLPKIEKLEELTPVIELYHHMVRAEKFDDALSLFRQRLHRQLYYQFGASQVYADLLQAFFLDGDDKPPRLKDKSAQAWTLNSLGNSYSLNGQPHRAVILFEMQNSIRESQGNKKSLAIGLGNIAGMAQNHIGALRKAEINLRRSNDLCHEIEDEVGEAIIHQHLGRVLSDCGTWEEAKQELDSALNLFEKHHEIQSQGVVWAHHALRFLHIARNNPQVKISNLKSAIKSASRALELANEDARTDTPVPRDYIRAYWLLGAAYRAMGNLPQAEENLSKAIGICRQINMVDIEANIILALARLRYDQKKTEEAKSLADEALLITERCGYVLQGADVNLFLAQYALEQEKNEEKARAHAEEALKLATCDGPPYYYKVAYEEAERFLENLK